jgi:hypothetical protein
MCIPEAQVVFDEELEAAEWRWVNEVVECGDGDGGLGEREGQEEEEERE